MKKILLLSVLLFMYSCGGETETAINETVNNSVSTTASGNIQQDLDSDSESTKNEIPPDTKITNVTDLKGLNYLESNSLPVIKSGNAIFTKSVYVFIDMCKDYELEMKDIAKSDIKNKIAEKTKMHIQDDLAGRYLNDYNALISGNIIGIYGKFSSLDNIDKVYNEMNKAKQDKQDFYFYLANYMLFIDDKSIYESYKNKYLQLLKNEKGVIDENYIVPLMSTELAQNGECKLFIENNFISY